MIWDEKELAWLDKYSQAIEDLQIGDTQLIHYLNVLYRGEVIEKPNRIWIGELSRSSFLKVLLSIVLLKYGREVFTIVPASFRTEGDQLVIDYYYGVRFPGYPVSVSFMDGRVIVENPTTLTIREAITKDLYKTLEVIGLPTTMVNLILGGQ